MLKFLVAVLTQWWVCVCLVEILPSVVWYLVLQENVLTDGEGEGSGEECEVTDECAMLLNTPAGAIHKVIKTQDKSGKFLFCNLLNSMTVCFSFLSSWFRAS